MPHEEQTGANHERGRNNSSSARATPICIRGNKTGAAKGIQDTEITLRMLFPAPIFRDAKIISCVMLKLSGMQWKTKPG